MGETVTFERIKNSLRRNIRRCKKLFCDFPEPILTRKRRLVKLINSMHELYGIQIEIYAFNVYGRAYYEYDKNEKVFKQTSTCINNSFSRSITPEEFVACLDASIFIVSDIKQL